MLGVKPYDTLPNISIFLTSLGPNYYQHVLHGHRQTEFRVGS